MLFGTGPNRSALRVPLISEHTDSICNDCLVELTGTGSRGEHLLQTRGLDFKDVSGMFMLALC